LIAVVDDDPRLLESMEDLLESANYRVRCFPSASSLLVSGLAGLDALVTDIGMPGIDGFELRDLLQKVRPELPVFLITGRHEMAEQGKARGITALFRKPFDSQALLAAIAGALGEREKEDEHED